MAPVQWSNLPGDILSAIAKISNSNIDLLRLRSVCSSWRSSLPLPVKPFSFPLKVPPLYSPAVISRLDDGDHLTLSQRTVYRLSPPATGSRAADPSSNGWLVKVWETNPNPPTFSLLDPLLSRNIQLPESMSNHLNLLNFRISEVCKSYHLSYRINCPIFSDKKVIALWNHVPDCDFAALVLQHRRSLKFWKFGDDCWTPIDIKSYYFQDLILHHGVCYAVDDSGVLVCFDSEFNLTVVAPSPPSDAPDNEFQHCLVEGESDLYMVSKLGDWKPEAYAKHLQRQPGDERVINFKLRLNKFDKLKGNWDPAGDLGDTIFLMCDDVSLLISPKDFGGCKGNRVYMNDICCDADDIWNDGPAVYHLDDEKAFELAESEDFGKLFGAPPSWLHA